MDVKCCTTSQAWGEIERKKQKRQEEKGKNGGWKRIEENEKDRRSRRRQEFRDMKWDMTEKRGRGEMKNAWRQEGQRNKLRCQEDKEAKENEKKKKQDGAYKRKIEGKVIKDEKQENWQQRRAGQERDDEHELSGRTEKDDEMRLEGRRGKNRWKKRRVWKRKWIHRKRGQG